MLFYRLKNSNCLLILNSGVLKPQNCNLTIRIENSISGDVNVRGSILLPNTDIKSMAAEVLPDKNALILVYCRAGRRSAIAARELISMGYTNVYDFGGINSWIYGTEKD